MKQITQIFLKVGVRLSRLLISIFHLFLVVNGLSCFKYCFVIKKWLMKESEGLIEQQ